MFVRSYNNTHRYTDIVFRKVSEWVPHVRTPLEWVCCRRRFCEWVCICALSHSLSRSSQRRLPAASSSSSKQSIDFQFALSHSLCVCVFCVLLLCALCIDWRGESSPDAILITPRWQREFLICTDRRRKWTPGKEKSKLVFVSCFFSVAADFLVSRALGETLSIRCADFSYLRKGFLAAGNGKYYFASVLSA